MGWAALLAVSVALYALGLTLQALDKDHGTQLIIVGVIIGVIATTIFVADLSYLGVGPLTRAWARRKPRLQLGLLDYLPESLKASAAITAALTRITKGMKKQTSVTSSRADSLLTETDAMKRQRLGYSAINSA